MARACNSSIGEAKVGGSENLKPAWTIYRALTPCLRKTIFKIVLKIIDSAVKLKRQTRLFQILGFPWKHYNNIKYVCIIRKKDKAELARACCLNADETWFCTMGSPQEGLPVGSGASSGWKQALCHFPCWPCAEIQPSRAGPKL